MLVLHAMVSESLADSLDAFRSGIVRRASDGGLYFAAANCIHIALVGAYHRIRQKFSALERANKQLQL